MRTLESKKHSVKSAAQRGTGLASTEFGCKWHRISKHRVWVHTPQTHLLGASRLPARSALLPAAEVSTGHPRPPKTPKRKDDYYRKKNREN